MLKRAVIKVMTKRRSSRGTRIIAAEAKSSSTALVSIKATTRASIRAAPDSSLSRRA